MLRTRTAPIALLSIATLFATTLGAGEIEIPYRDFVLDNGLRLIVHEDHKAPIVSINVWYHVGSKDEKPGKTGFAHLFEHLMFNGSENFDDDYFIPFDRVGATKMNGTTNADRTNYFQNVPSPSLDFALWMESDRMGHLLGAIDQAKLDEQRDVVKNEKRQGENQPYGSVFRILSENAYPKGHPYSWSTIGSMEDLDAASLDDVKTWFRDYYGAANAVISIAGDVDADTVFERVKAHFGDIPAGPPVNHAKHWIAERHESRRLISQDRVPQARIIKAWNVPPIGSTDGDILDLASTILGGGKTSRLYQRLVYEEQVATDVTAFVWLRELGGLFVVWATAQPGQDLAEVERLLDQEVARFVAKGPTRSELARAKTQDRAAFIRGIEQIGGFGGKSDILAQSAVYLGHPGAYRERLAQIDATTRKDVNRSVKRWLHDGVFILEVQPFPAYTTGSSPIDRSKLPDPGVAPGISFPRFERVRLANGLEVIIAERHSVPIVNFDLLIDAGYAADHGALAGTASLVLDMLDEGTSKRSAIEISERLADLGAELTTRSNLDISSVSLSALKKNLDASLDLFADVILDPRFDGAEFERLRKQQLATISREKATPLDAALRVFPRILYGDDHAYGLPFTGTGTEASVKELTPAHLREFHTSWFQPQNATLVVVGDITAAQVLPKLESLFGRWKGTEIPQKDVATIAGRETSAVYLIDRPGSSQSIVMAGQLAPPKANPDEIAIESMNEILGGSFTARINMNLREDKHWSYGARSVLFGARGQRPFLVYAAVQTDKTAESLAEIHREVREIRGSRPPTQEEVAIAKDKRTLTLPGRWETGRAVARAIGQIVRFGYEDDHWTRYPEAVRAVDLDDVRRAAKEVLHPDGLIWVVVGDREKIEAKVRRLGLGALHIIDADGNLLQD